MKMKLDLREELTRFATKLDVPAVGGGVIAADGTSHLDVIGVCRRGSQQKASLDHQWHIGSCTKSITAAVYSRLIEQGRTSWEARIGDLFSDLRGRIHPAWESRTVDELFYCRAGMPANPSLKSMRASWGDTRPLPEQRTDTAVAAMTSAPNRVGKFAYSNLSYITIGAAIDRLTNGSYERALEELLLAPIGITSLGSGAPPNIWGHSGRLRLGSLVLFKGKPMPPGDPHSDNPSVFSSAGTLHLTLADWTRFLRLFIKGTRGPLEPETIDTLLSGPHDYPMIRGWSRTEIPGTSLAMQGSNTLWAATAVLSENLDRASLVACNDGRTRVVMQSAMLAARFLEMSESD